MSPSAPGSPDEVRTALDAAGYLVDDGLATAIFLALSLGQPLLLEGEPGVGKTTAAKALAGVLDAPLIRLQCYEGLGAAEALYEWNYQRQLLALRVGEARHEQVAEDDLFAERFLEERPILRAVRHTGESVPVLLIDEIDRADDEFEAFLLELLSEYAVTIPELGTIRAAVPPLVVLTSNRTRELHDALKRRCFYHWVAHPDPEREVAILRTRLPELGERLARQVAAAAAALRAADLVKPPGVAETLDWARALLVLGADELDGRTAAATLGAVLKYREDIEQAEQLDLSALLAARALS